MGVAVDAPFIIFAPVQEKLITSVDVELALKVVVDGIQLMVTGDTTVKFGGTKF